MNCTHFTSFIPHVEFMGHKPKGRREIQQNEWAVNREGKDLLGCIYYIEAHLQFVELSGCFVKKVRRQQKTKLTFSKNLIKYNELLN